MTSQSRNRRALARFFASDRNASVSVAETAELLGMTTAQAGRFAEVEGALSWEEVAYHLFGIRSRAELLAAAGPDGVPAELQLERVAWRLPRYVLRAMRHQAAQERRTLDDYVADVLHERIDLETVEALRDERAFIEAFYFPSRPSE